MRKGAEREPGNKPRGSLAPGSPLASLSYAKATWNCKLRKKMFLPFMPCVLECSIKYVIIVWNFHCSKEDFSSPNPGRRCNCESTNIKSYFLLFIQENL